MADESQEDLRPEAEAPGGSCADEAKSDDTASPSVEGQDELKLPGPGEPQKEGPPAEGTADAGQNAESNTEDTAVSASPQEESTGVSTDATGGDSVSSGAVPDEVHVNRIVKPHLFHVPEVSGLVVPTVTASDGQLKVQMRLYLQCRDGRREWRPMAGKLDLPSGESLWFSGTGEASMSNIGQCWSVEGRQRFIRGYTPNSRDLFRSVRAALQDYVEFPELGEGVSAQVVALWTMMTYAYPAWPAVPYLAIRGSWGSGKTRLFEVLVQMVHRPLPSANITAPCMFRTLHSQGGTLLLDEAERLRERSPEAAELRSILLSGYKAGNPARRLEKKGESYHPQFFDVYGPKAIAAIDSFPDTLESRCIRITMVRAPRDSEAARRRIEQECDRWQRLRDDLHAFALANGRRFRERAGQTELCDGFGGRDYELWHPLIALAHFIEEAGETGLVSAVRRFAQDQIEQRVEHQIPKEHEHILGCLAKLVQQGQQEKTPQELLECARGQAGPVIPEWRPRGLSNVLERYGITSKKIHGRRTFRYVTVDHLRRIEKTHGLDLGLGCAPCDPCAPMTDGSGSEEVQVASHDVDGHPESPPPGPGGAGGAGVDVVDVPSRHHPSSRPQAEDGRGGTVDKDPDPGDDRHDPRGTSGAESAGQREEVES
ncbi:MAG: hypothetical protein ACYSUI_01590 [Planctomycetota bacterium]|jgi:hypothetical protein